MKKLLVEGQDFYVRVLPFPNNATDGAIMGDPDGNYNIYINSNVSAERQWKALQHEVKHMVRDDVFSEESREQIERRMI